MGFLSAHHLASGVLSPYIGMCPFRVWNKFKDTKNEHKKKHTSRERSITVCGPYLIRALKGGKTWRPLIDSCNRSLEDVYVRRIKEGPHKRRRTCVFLCVCVCVCVHLCRPCLPWRPAHSGATTPALVGAGPSVSHRVFLWRAGRKHFVFYRPQLPG